MRRLFGSGLGAFAFLLATAGGLTAQNIAQNPAWTTPFPPFHLAGNLYYVGASDLAVYLVVTPKGSVLINCGVEADVPLIEASIAKLGFRLSDTKIILISHAHFDHDGGCAAIKATTGARYMVMDADVPVVESGGKADFQYNTAADLYPTAKVDRVLHDGDVVALGDAKLVAHLTPGHTKGCTTWTMTTTEAGKSLAVVIVGSANVNPGYKLVNNPAYPGMAADYERTFRVLHALPCELFLGAHGAYFGLHAKYAALSQPGEPNPFVDPGGYAKFVANAEQAFQTEWAKQKRASP